MSAIPINHLSLRPAGVGLVTFLVQNIGTYISGSSADVLPMRYG